MLLHYSWLLILYQASLIHIAEWHLRNFPKLNCYFFFMPERLHNFIRSFVCGLYRQIFWCKNFTKVFIINNINLLSHNGLYIFKIIFHTISNRTATYGQQYLVIFYSNDDIKYSLCMPTTRRTKNSIQLSTSKLLFQHIFRVWWEIEEIIYVDFTTPKKNKCRMLLNLRIKKKLAKLHSCQTLYTFFSSELIVWSFRNSNQTFLDWSHTSGHIDGFSTIVTGSNSNVVKILISM